MISSNPFRFIGVLSNSGAKLIQKNLSKIKAYSKIGRELSLPFELNFLNLEKLNRTDASTIDAENKILLDPNKIKYALFWFIDASSIDQIALANLEKGDFEKSITIWEKVIKENPISKTNFSAYNNLSTLLLIKSLSKKDNDRFENSNDSIETIKKALKLKSELIFSDYLSLFSKLICGNENVVSSDEILKFFNDKISYLFEKNFTTLEISTLINDSNKKLSSSFNYSLINKPLNALTGLINDSNDELKADNSKGIEIGKQLIKNAISHLKLLLSILGKDDIKFQSISDNLANQIMQCGILCFNKTGDDKDFLSSYKYALSISIKDSAKERANETIKHCKEQQEANICKFCNSNEILRKSKSDFSKSLRIQMHKMNYLGNSYEYFKNGGLEITACSSCRSKSFLLSNQANILTFVTYAALNLITSAIFSSGETIFIPFVLGLDVLFAKLWIWKYIHGKYKESYFTFISKHPLIKSSLVEGYKFGMP